MTTSRRLASRATLMLALAGLLGAAAPVASAAPGAGGGGGGGGGGASFPFTVSPSTLSFSAAVGGSNLQTVTVSVGKKAAVYVNPATSSSGAFTDTGQGSCVQQYLALGQAIPARTTCTIQVRYAPTATGTDTGSLTITDCTRWSGTPVTCSRLDGSATVALSGTATPAPRPDLVVASVELGAPAGSPQANTANPWTAVIRNDGNAAAEINLVAISGAYSTNTTKGDGDDAGACGTVLSQIPGTTLAAGASVTVAVGCSAPRSGSFLLVSVDDTDLVSESNETNNTASLAL